MRVIVTGLGFACLLGLVACFAHASVDAKQICGDYKLSTSEGRQTLSILSK